MKFDNPSLDLLHREHTKWVEEIKFWNTEIKFLKKILSRILEKNPDETINEKAKKYLNHLDHNLRFLKGISETIYAHESFLKHNLELNISETIISEDEDELSDVQETFEVTTDHDKTRQHLADFRKRYDRLKIKIFQIHEKFNKKS